MITVQVLTRGGCRVMASYRVGVGAGGTTRLSVDPLIKIRVRAGLSMSLHGGADNPDQF